MAVDPNFGWVRSLIQGNSTANLADTKWPTEVVGSTAGTDYIGLANGSVTVSPPGAIGAYDFDTSTSPTYIYIFRQAVIANNPTWVPGARIMETEDVVILCGSSPGTLVAESRNGLAILSMSLRVPIIGQYKLELTSWTAWGGDSTTYVAYVDRTAGGFYGALSSAFTIGSDYGGPSAFQPKTGFTKLGGTAGGQSLVDTPTFTLTKNTTVAGYLPLSAAVTASANVGQDYLGYTDTYADLVGQKVYISSGGTANYLVTLDTVPGSSNGRSFTPSSLVSGTVTLRVGRGTTQSPYFTASVKVAGMTVVQAASVAAQSLVAQVNAAYAGQGLPAASAVTGLQTTSESISKSFTSTYPAGFASGVQVHPAGVYSGTLSGTRTKEYTAVTLNLPILENGMSWGPVGVSTADLVLEPGLPPKTSDFTDGPVIYGGAYGRGAGVRGVVTLTVTGAQNAANGASVLSGIAYTPSAADATGFFAAQFDSIATPVFSSSSGSSTVVLTTKTPMAFSQSLLDAARVGYRAATGSGIDRLYGFRVTLAKSSTDAITLPWPTTSIPPATGGGGVVTVPSADVLLAVSMGSGVAADLSQYGSTHQIVGSSMSVVGSGSRTGDEYIRNTDGSQYNDAYLNYTVSPSMIAAWQTATAMTLEFDLRVDAFPFSGGHMFGWGRSGGYISVIVTAGVAYLTTYFAPGLFNGIPVPVGSWHHVAFVAEPEVAGAQRFVAYVDGIEVDANIGTPLPFVGDFTGYQGDRITFFQNSATMAGANGSLQGGIDNILITKSAKYTSNFTPPGAIPFTGTPSSVGDGVSMPSNVLFAVSANSGYIHDQGQYGLIAQPTGTTLSYPTSGSRTGDGYISNPDGTSGNDARIKYALTAPWFSAWSAATSMTCEYDIRNDQVDFAGGQFMQLMYGNNVQNNPASGKWTIASSLLGSELYSPPLDLGRWYHIAHVADGTDRTLRMYVDGVLVSSDVVSAGQFGFEAWVDIDALSLLQLHDVAGNGSLNGGIDNIVITAAAKYTTNFTPPTSFVQAVGGTLIPSNADVTCAGYNTLDEITSAGAFNTQANQPDAYFLSFATLGDALGGASFTADANGVTFSGARTLANATNTGTFVRATPTNFSGTSTLDDATATASFYAGLPLEWSGSSALDDATQTAVYLFLAPSEFSGSSTLSDSTASGGVYTLETPPTMRATLTGPRATLTARSGHQAVAESPSPTLLAAGSPSVLSGAVIDMPAATLVARTGHQATLNAPRASLTAAGTIVNMARAIMTMPMPYVGAAGRVSGQSTVQISAPRVTLAAQGGHQAVLTAPKAALQANAIPGGVAQASLSMPAATVTASGYRSDSGIAVLTAPRMVPTPSGTARLAAPRMSVIARGQPVAAQTFEAYSLNLLQPLDDNPRNNFEAKIEQASRYTQWPFVQVVRMGNTHVAVGAGGVYELGGNTDDGADIPWAFETCVTDFKEPHRKTIASVYVSGQAGPEVTYTLRSGDDADQTYAYTTTKVTQKRNHRQKFGLGRRARYYAIGLVGEGKLAVDGIELELINTTRRI